jgi:uncharacterized protein DUF4157
VPGTRQPDVVNTFSLAASLAELEAEKVADRLLVLYGRHTRIGELLEISSDALGRDLTSVQLHTGPTASLLATAAGASALTIGRHIIFGCGYHAANPPARQRILAHELVHVVQQTAVPMLGNPKLSVQHTRLPGIQCRLDPQANRFVCPPGRVQLSHPSSPLLGTLYGKWLGLQYVRERRPISYGVVDWHVYFGYGNWTPKSIYALKLIDPTVFTVMVTSEWSQRRIPMERTDILDSDLDEVYEIKPVRDRAKGPAQLDYYLDILKKFSKQTSLAFGPQRDRDWHGGDWDPSPYELVIPGSEGRIYIIHAWCAPEKRGLLLYDLVSCETPDEQQEAQPALVATRYTLINKELKHSEELVAVFERMREQSLPIAPKGSTYALLATERFFTLFVLDPLQKRQDRMYQVRLTPALQKFALDTLVLSYGLAPLPTVGAALWSGVFDPEELAASLRQLGPKVAEAILIVDAAVALVAVIVLLPEVAALVAAEGVPEAAGIAEGLSAFNGAALEGAETLATETTAETVMESGFLNGAGTVQVGRAAANWTINGGPGAGLGGGLMGIGMVGAAVLGLAPQGAEAAESPNRSAAGKVVGIDPLTILPIDMLVPRRGKIELDAEVTVGDQKLYIIGLITAEA